MDENTKPLEKHTKRELAEEYAERIYAHSRDHETSVRMFMGETKERMLFQVRLLISRGQ